MDSITLEQFKKLDLRVGKVEAIERVEGSDRLYKIKVDLGSEKRQIISGLVPYYSPDDLLHKNLIVICNLEPRTIMGLESQGMLLNVDSEDKPIPLSTLLDAQPGSQVR